MKMVENMEEHFLRSVQVLDKLNIIHQQYIYRLIEAEEICQFVVLGRSHILHLEVIGAKVKHAFVGIKRFDLITYRVEQVSFAHSGTTVYKKRIEGCLSRVASHG